MSNASKQTKIILLYSALAGLLMLAILNVFLFDSSPVENNHKDNVAISKPVDAPSIQSQSNAIAHKTESNQIANSLFNQGQQQILHNNYGAALMSINTALKENPDLTAAKQLKQDIEFEFEVRAYLARAENLLARGRLTKPTDNNAYQSYTKLATLLPPGDKRASDGLLKVADSYYRLANDAVFNKQYDSATKYISTGLGVIADYPPLKQLELYINQQQRKLQEQQRIQAERLEKQQKAANLTQQKQQQFLEQQRLAKKQQEQQHRLQQQQELEKSTKLRIENKKIYRMIGDARSLLRRDRLSSESLNSALKIHSELTTSTQNDTRIPDLFQQIIKSYGELARTQKAVPNLVDALSTINQGLALDSKNTRLLRIKQDIETLLSEAEKKKPQVPIIGTF